MFTHQARDVDATFARLSAPKTARGCRPGNGWGNCQRALTWSCSPNLWKRCIFSSELEMAGMIQRLGRRSVWCTTRPPAGGLGESWQELWSFEQRSQSWVATDCKIQIRPSEENMTQRTARRWSFDASFGLLVLSSDLNLEFLTVQERELRTLGQHGPAEKARRTVSLSVLCSVEW